MRDVVGPRDYPPLREYQPLRIADRADPRDFADSRDYLRSAGRGGYSSPPAARRHSLDMRSGPFSSTSVDVNLPSINLL